MSKAEKYLLIILFASTITIGLFIVRDFGVSYDEPEYYLYAQKSVDAYGSFFALAYSPDFGPHDLPHYGPAFIIFPELAIRFLRLLFPSIFPANVWHFSYFFLFNLGGLCFYSLARRWFDPWNAWGTLLLYLTQPLLWGHAFMNPKDIPFMVFSLFTLWSGFRLADSLGAQNPKVALRFPKIDKLSLPRFSVKESLPCFRSPQLLLAGILLGTTMSIRLLGPLPGLIVVLYLVSTLGQDSVPVITAYLICAVIAMFFTWPYLWPNPIDHWMDSLVLMVKFPWPARVLFNGQFYDPDNLPRSYLPILLSIQLTEPLVIMIYLGLIAFIFFIFRRTLKLDLFLVILGAVFPLAGLILAGATMYDNFRQILFIIPPLILLAGLVLDYILSYLKPAALRLVLLIALAFPGIYSIIQLHPYQYIYYNSFVGGTGGALRKFELDYWFTSYRETALWLNEHTRTNANVGGVGPIDLLYIYLRSDLNPPNKSKADSQYDYFVTTSRYNEDLTFYPDAEVIHFIERDGAVLVAIKQISP